MLLQLEINNIALIDKISMEFGNGLNVLTGETGAGKSIIIDSIKDILGARFSRELIRTGTEKSMVQALFRTQKYEVTELLEQSGMEPEEDGTLVITRENTMNGRNTCRINGRITTVSNLKNMGENLIDIHGQHDNQSLLRKDYHIELLDMFTGGKIDVLKEKYGSLMKRRREIKTKLKNFVTDDEQRNKKIDFLKFQIDEIKKSNLSPGEEEELEKQKDILSNAENIIKVLAGSYELLFSGTKNTHSARDIINESLEKIIEIEDYSDKYSTFSERLQDITYRLEDITEEIRKERDMVEYDPQELERIEERLNMIYGLKRKYGSTIEDILDYCHNIEHELEDLVSNDELIEKLNKELDEVEKKLYETAKKLNSQRKKAAKVLESKIGTELAELEMKKAKFKVDIKFDKDNKVRFMPDGMDKVEFLFSPNIGEPLKSLSKIASGGEMSRIMLAVKTILADVDRIPVLIFDEIDMGVGGRVAQKVGEKLAELSGKHQVICITHLPQIACMADNHYFVEKYTEGKVTKTRVMKLEGRSRKEGIARLLGGTKITDITLEHADEMLENANKFKN